MRDINPKLSAALREKIVRPVQLLEVDHPEGTLRLWTGIGHLSYNGFIWTGSGGLISMEAVEETTELKVLQAQLTMPAPDFSDEALELLLTPATRVPIHRWLAFLDAKSNVIPDAIYRGKMYGNPPSISDDGAGIRTVSMVVEGAVFNLTKGADTLLSNEEQIARFPGDSGLEKMSAIANQQLTWTTGSYNSFTPPP